MSDWLIGMAVGGIWIAVWKLSSIAEDVRLLADTERERRRDWIARVHGS